MSMSSAVVPGVSEIMLVSKETPNSDMGVNGM